MVKILFWNVAKRVQPHLVKSICDEHEVDILALAELDGDVPTFVEKINIRALRTFHEVQSIAKRVTILSRLPIGSIEPLSDDEQIFVRKITPPIGKDAVLVAVHFPSKLRMTDSEQSFEAVRLIRAIEEAEARVGHSRTVVIGDLNMNPFEDGMIASDGLHAVMDRRIAAGEMRTVRAKEKRFMYNPMWRFFGNGASGPPGTYFLNDSSHICFFWNIFDQVLIRPDLLDYFSDDNLKIIDVIDGVSLLRDNGRIRTEISDHLPIVAAIELERMV